jgi:hypothetical protein
VSGSSVPRSRTISSFNSLGLAVCSIKSRAPARMAATIVTGLIRGPQATTHTRAALTQRRLIASIAGCGLSVRTATKATLVGLSRISRITAFVSDPWGKMRTNRTTLATLVPLTFRTRAAASFRLCARTVTATNGLLILFKPTLPIARSPDRRKSYNHAQRCPLRGSEEIACSRISERIPSHHLPARTHSALPLR